MRQILAFFILLTTLFCQPAAYAEEQLPVGDFSELKRLGLAKVTAIIDPQTVQLDDGTLVRLIGLNFPDFNVEEAGDLSLTAQTILKDMLLSQSVVLYQTKKKNWGRTNRLGHELAHIERQSDKAWVQGVLLQLGLARVQTGQRNPEMAAQMYAQEQKARAEKLGLWEKPEYTVLTPENAEEHINAFQIVEGEIKSVATKKNRIYLNFGGNWRDDFTISIAPEHKRHFSKQSLDPMQWGGQRVRVRGWLESYNGPLIEVNHPEAIELIN